MTLIVGKEYILLHPTRGSTIRFYEGISKDHNYMIDDVHKFGEIHIVFRITGYTILEATELNKALC